MQKYIMALDAGTSSTRSIIFDHGGRVCSVSQREYFTYYPRPGWVEQDPHEILTAQSAACSLSMFQMGIDLKDIDSIGITNQRETTILWDKTTTIPVYRAIVWQDLRTADYCDELVRSGVQDMIHKKTGLIINPYFSATKIRWILENVPKAKETLKKGNLLFGTVDTWLVWMLSGGNIHATDCTNASRTMLFNINTMDWDDELLELFGIPRSILPEVKPSSGMFGETSGKVLLQSVPITGVAGDQHCALFGQTCFNSGDVKSTYGTGGFLLMNTGDRPFYSRNSLLTTIAWKIGSEVQYALEGSVFIAGSAIQWLRDSLRIVDSAEDTEYYASKVSDTNDCYVVPAFTGLGAPYWDSYARGTIVGLTRGTNKCHIIRATLESLAFQTYEVLMAMESDSGTHFSALKVDGGAVANRLLMQMQADLLQAPVIRPLCYRDTTALGAAFLAGLATGYWKDLNELKKCWTCDHTSTPAITPEERDKKIRRWRKAIAAAHDWAKDEE